MAYNEEIYSWDGLEKMTHSKGFLKGLTEALEKLCPARNMDERLAAEKYLQLVYSKLFWAEEVAKVIFYRFDDYYGKIFKQLIDFGRLVGYEYATDFLKSSIPEEIPEGRSYRVNYSLTAIVSFASKTAKMVRKKNKGFIGFSEKETEMLFAVSEDRSYTAENRLNTYLAIQTSKNKEYWERMEGTINALNESGVRSLYSVAVKTVDKLAKARSIPVNDFTEDVLWIHTSRLVCGYAVELKLMQLLTTDEFELYRNILGRLFPEEEMEEADWRRIQALMVSKDFFEKAVGFHGLSYGFDFLQDVVPLVKENVSYEKIGFLKEVIKEILPNSIPNLGMLRDFLSGSKTQAFYKFCKQNIGELDKIRKMLPYDLTTESMKTLLALSKSNKNIDLSFLDNHTVKKKDLARVFSLRAAGLPDEMLFA